MSDMLFCYCCRVFHDKAGMRQFQTRAGRRWRCLASIEAARRSREERDAFGRQQTEINRDHAQAGAGLLNHWRPELRRP